MSAIIRLYLLGVFPKRSRWVLLAQAALTAVVLLSGPGFEFVRAIGWGQATQENALSVLGWVNGGVVLPAFAVQGAIASRIHRLYWRAMGVSDFKSFAAMSLSSVTEQCVSAALAWAGRAAMGEPLSDGPTLVPMLLCAAGTAAMMGVVTCARHTGLNT